jgi:transglutaminase-like putative cysteine protease
MGYSPMATINFTDGAAALPDMRWVVSCDLALTIVESAEVVIQVVAARSAGHVLHERFQFSAGEGIVDSALEVSGPEGARLQVVHAEPGPFTVAYRGELQSETALSRAVVVAAPGFVDHHDQVIRYERQLFLRPSRYCPSDHLVGFAVAEFGTGTNVRDRVSAITAWISDRIGYVPGSSSVHDSAEDTLLTAMGTCRDFAHLGIALCRATGVPARFAAVYAPGLSPMDFHAVFETLEDGEWCVHDATGLAPRQSLVRVVTGRDAADTAFVAITSGVASLDSVEVSATVNPTLPIDDFCSVFVLP